MRRPTDHQMVEPVQATFSGLKTARLLGTVSSISRNPVEQRYSKHDLTGVGLDQ